MLVRCVIGCLHFLSFDMGGIVDFLWLVLSVLMFEDVYRMSFFVLFFFQAEDGIRDLTMTGVQTCALPIFALPPLGLFLRRGGLLGGFGRLGGLGRFGRSFGLGLGFRLGGGLLAADAAHFGLGHRLGVRRFGLGFGGRLGGVLGLLGRLLAVGEIALALVVALEVGLVPTGTFQTKHRGGDQFLELRLFAARAVAQRLIGNFLQDLDVELAVTAFVFVKRHGCSRDTSLTSQTESHWPVCWIEGDRKSVV